MATLPHFAHLADEVTRDLIRCGYLAVHSELPWGRRARMLQVLEDFHSTKGICSDD